MWCVAGILCDDVHHATHSTVGEHRRPESFLHLNGVGGIGKSHPIAPIHRSGGEPLDRYSIEHNRDIVLLEASHIESGIAIAACGCCGIYAGDALKHLEIVWGRLMTDNVGRLDGGEIERCMVGIGKMRLHSHLLEIDGRIL